MQNSRGRLIAPIAILVVGGLVAWAILATREHVEPKPPDVPRPLVRTVVVQPERLQFVVEANGTVTPSTEGDLVPQVSGEVVWVSPVLAPGGFFDAGEPLLRIDRADYQVALDSAQANVAAARSEFARAEKERQRQRQLADRSVASESRIDDAENAYRVALARLREAESQLERAHRDLERTELFAPYDGRVRSESVDVGQFVSRGSPVARLYAVDFAEVRLPLPDRELAYLDLALDYRDTRSGHEADRSESRSGHEADRSESAAAADAGEIDGALDIELEPESGAGLEDPRVVLSAEFAGEVHQWQGRIVRTEGEIDPKTRMVQVVARVPDPYGRSQDDARPPLAVGLFVHAEIMGRVVEEAFVVPRSALRDWEGRSRDQVLVVDAESRLHFRDVEVLRAERDRVVLGSGLQAGERVLISPLRAVAEGMFVEIAEAGPGDVEITELGS